MIKSKEEAISAIAEWEKELYSNQEVQEIQEYIISLENKIVHLKKEEQAQKKVLEEINELLSFGVQSSTVIEEDMAIIFGNKLLANLKEQMQICDKMIKKCRKILSLDAQNRAMIEKTKKMILDDNS